MMRTLASTLAACAALAAPVALAQSVAITGTPTTPFMCDSGVITQGVSTGMTVFTDLPAGPNNVIILTALNGGTPVTTFATEPSGSSSVNTGTIFLYTPSSTSPPYTMDRWTFPASGGVAIGTGVHEAGTCSAAFEAAITWTNGVLPEGGGGGGGGPVQGPAPTWTSRTSRFVVCIAVRDFAAASDRSRERRSEHMMKAVRTTRPSIVSAFAGRSEALASSRAITNRARTDRGSMPQCGRCGPNARQSLPCRRSEAVDP